MVLWTMEWEGSVSGEEREREREREREEGRKGDGGDNGEERREKECLTCGIVPEKTPKLGWRGPKLIGIGSGIKFTYFCSYRR
jgi:hypothetical protein